MSLQWVVRTLMVMSLAAPVAAEVPVAQDLAADAAAARAAGTPLLLVFAQDHCDWCERLDRQILNPQYDAGSFNGRAVVRKVMIDSSATLRDFSGKPADSDEFSKRFRVYVTPTVLLVDAKGTELVPRIVGIENDEFYSAYLEEAIEVARGRMR